MLAAVRFDTRQLFLFLDSGWCQSPVVKKSLSTLSMIITMRYNLQSAVSKKDYYAFFTSQFFAVFENFLKTCTAGTGFQRYSPSKCSIRSCILSCKIFVRSSSDGSSLSDGQSCCSNSNSDAALIPYCNGTIIMLAKYKPLN